MDRATEYARAVVAGVVMAGPLVRAACARHIADLARDDIVWDETASESRIELCGKFRQSKGRWAGEPLTLLPWQCFVVGSIFGWKTPNGLRRFRRAYIEVARKNGKSTLAAALGLIMLDFDGEPGAEVYAAATMRPQARIVWDEAARMVRQTPALLRRIEIIDSRANMHIRGGVSKFEALGADTDNLDGLNPSCVIVDELHAHRGRALVDVMETALGAREQPLIVYITTAGIDAETVYREMHDYAVSVVSRRMDDDRVFGYVATLDDDDDWQDERHYVKANPSLGATVQLDELRAECERARVSVGAQNAFRRLRLNQRVSAASGWIDMTEWDACADGSLTLADFAGRACWAGLDLASTRDVTALTLVARSEAVDGGYDCYEMYWVPGDTARKRSRSYGVPYESWISAEYMRATPGNVTDYSVIREYIADLRDKYEINLVEIAYDRWNADETVIRLQDEGFSLVGFGQGYVSMAAPCRALETMIAGRRIRHRGSPVTRWMAGNVIVSQDPAGNVKPDKDKSSDKIDGIVALLMALGRAAAATRSDGIAPGGSVYDGRGVVYV